MTPERIAELRREVDSYDKYDDGSRGEMVDLAREALPEALDEVERLRGEVERLRTALSTGTLALREQLRKARLPGGMTQDGLLRELEEHYGPLEGFRAWLPKS
uniref:Uncharacterized protein n=1 Tax=viral metagenome TaxID=1070528 RepID=A0A6H2A041_9ZZZZ